MSAIELTGIEGGFFSSLNSYLFQPFYGDLFETSDLHGG